MEEDKLNKNKEGRLKKIKKVIFKKKTLKIILVAAMLITVFGGASYQEIIKPNDAQNSKNKESANYRPYGPSPYQESMKEVEPENIEEDGLFTFDMSTFDMYENDERYRKYYIYDYKELEYLLNAELVNQYPYIESIPEGKFNGTIRFYRKDNEEPMVYKSEEEFQELVDTYNSGDYSVLDEALNIFTIHRDAIKIAYLSDAYSRIITNDAASVQELLEESGATATTYVNDEGNTVIELRENQLYTTHIAYKNATKNYVIPFNLLWEIITYGDDRKAVELAKDIAKIAYEGETSFIIDDRQTIEERSKQYTYTRTNHYNGQFSVVVRQYIREINSNILIPRLLGLINNEPPKNIANYEVYLSNCFQSFYYRTDISNPILEVKKIESWCALFENDATYSDETTSNEDEPVIRTEEDTPEVDASPADIGWGTALSIPINDLLEWKNYLENTKYVNGTRGRDSEGNLVEYTYLPVYNGSLHVTTNITNRQIVERFRVQRMGYRNGTVTSPVVNPKIREILNGGENDRIARALFGTQEKIDTFCIQYMEKNEDTADLKDIARYIFYQNIGNYLNVDFDTVWDKYLERLSPANRERRNRWDINLTSTHFSKDEFIEKVQSYSPAINMGERTEVFRERADIIYDVCVASNINPVLCAAQAWQEQNWDDPYTSAYNYWGIGVYNGQDYGEAWPSMTEAVQGYCDQINSQMSGDLRSVYQARAAEFATVNSKFVGDMSNMYDIFSAYAWIGEGHTLSEEANYAAEYVESIISCANNIFGYGALQYSYDDELYPGGIMDQLEANSLNMTYSEYLGGVAPNSGVTAADKAGPFERYWDSSYNPIGALGYNYIFQCTWWAWGRASMYLESKYGPGSRYPENQGNGGEYYDNNKRAEFFNYGKTPKIHSLVSMKSSIEQWRYAGHIAYVEGVTEDGIWISDASGGTRWNGVRFMSYSTLIPKIEDEAGHSYGFIYLDEPINWNGN